MQSIASLRSRVREHGFFASVLLLLAALYVLWTWSDQLGHLGGDSAYYLMMARAYAPFGPHDELFANVAASSRFPPLYPLLLAVSGAADSLLMTHLVTTATLVFALLALYVWLVRSGASAVAASAVAFVVALLPQTLLLGLWPQSEYPYLWLSFLGLLAMQHYRRQPTTTTALYVAIVVTAACLTRSIGVALLAPAAWIFLTSGRPRHLPFLFIPALAFVGWTASHPSQTDYAATLSMTYGSDAWSRLLVQLGNQPRLFRYGFAGSFIQTTGLQPIVDGLGILVLAASACRLWRREPDAMYALAYVVIVGLWPYPEEIARLIWPVVPVALGGVVLEAGRLSHRLSHSMSQLVTCLVPAAVLVVISPMLAFTADRFAMADAEAVAYRRLPEWYELDPHQALLRSRTYSKLVAAFERLSDHVPPEDCVVNVKPQLVKYFAHRRGVLPPLNSVADPLFMDRLRGSGCRYILMVAWKDSVYPAILHPLARVKDSVDWIDREIIVNDAGPNDYLVSLLGRLKPLAQVDK